MQSTENKVISRIYGKGRGWAFFKNDFVDLGSANTVDLVLHRLLKKGKIRRVIRGVYDYPKYSKLLEQDLSPDIDQVAQALARKHGWEIQISGNTALNVLGLSTQVPTKYLYFSDGKSKVYQIGNIELEFKKTALKDIGFKYPESVLVVQAIKALSIKKLTEKQKQTIFNYFRPEKHERILKDTKYTTSWVYEVIKSVFNDEE